MSDLEQIITDSVNDSLNDVETETPELDASPEAPDEPVEATEPEADAEPEADVEVSSPASQTPPEGTPAEPQDEFAKLAGVPQIGVGGRENRIPYSRVKKITEKAANEAEARVAEAVLGRKLNPGEKAADVVKAHVAQLPELQTKVTDYEARLTNVGRFEDVMQNDPQQFLTMLSKLPAYKDFFDFVASAAKQTDPAAAQTPATPVSDNMPEPDETLSDGSKVYSMEGLKSLLAWNSQQTEARVSGKYETALEARIKELDARYGPVASDWQERRRVEAALPVIRKKLEEAKTWPMFTESEDEILQVLNADTEKKLTLDDAYRQVVFPKLMAERNKQRQDILAEVKSAPTSTSVQSRSVTKPVAPNEGNRSLEEIIKAQVDTLKR